MTPDDAIDTRLAEVVQKLVASESDLKAIAVRGSYVTARMTSTSDIDLFVITDTTGPESFHLPSGGLDFHIRRFPERYLRYEVGEGNLRYIGFFRHSKALYDPSRIFAGLKSEVDEIPMLVLAYGWLNEVRHQSSDIQGQLEIGDYQTSLYLIRIGAVLLAQTALLVTPQATYKHKDIIASLRESSNLAKLRDKLLDVIDVKDAHEEMVIQRYDLFTSAISAVEEYLSTQG